MQLFVLYFKMSRGHNCIVYGGIRNFLYKNGAYNFFVMSLDFAENKNIKNMSMGMTYRTHQALQLLYFDLFLMKQYTRINHDV